MRIERAKVLLRSGLDVVSCDVFGHEIPLLANIHGSADHLTLHSRGTFAEVDDPEAEYERLENAYGLNKNGVPQVELVYQGGGMVFGTGLAETASGAIDRLAKRDAAKHPHEPGPGEQNVQPKQGEDGYLDKKELGRMLEDLTSEPVDVKRIRRDGLRARTILALEEAMEGRGIPVPSLVTDRDLGAAFATYQNFLAAANAPSE